MRILVVAGGMRGRKRIYPQTSVASNTISVILPTPMPRDRVKRVELKTVDDQSEPVAVVRLGPAKYPLDTEPPVRLGPVKKAAKESPECHELPRSYASKQPDLIDLVDSQNNANILHSESGWGEDSGGGSKRLWGWFFLVGCLLTTAVVWSLLSIRKAHKAAEKNRSQSIEAMLHEAAQQKEVQRIIDELESTIRAFFGATTIDGRLRWVRFPERVAPMMTNFHQNRDLVANPLHKIRSLELLPINFPNQFWMARVLLATGEVQELILEYTEEGPKIDWETMVIHQPMSWDEFVTERPAAKAMDFRVYAEPAALFSHEFADENESACYRLTVPDQQEVIFGYVRHGTEVADELASLTQDSRRASVVLRLRIPAALHSPVGVVIEKVVSPRWLLVTLPE